MANKFYGTGRRKKSIARVYLVPGTGKITINKRDIDEYFGLETLKVVVRQPLVATETVDNSKGMGLLAAGLVTGLAGIGGGIAVAAGAPAAIAATAEDPKSFGKSIIFVALGESIALYGVVISILILQKV